MAHGCCSPFVSCEPDKDGPVKEESKCRVPIKPLRTVPQPPKGYHSWLEYCVDSDADSASDQYEAYCARQELGILYAELARLTLVGDSYNRAIEQLLADDTPGALQTLVGLNVTLDYLEANGFLGVDEKEDEE